MSYLDGDIVFVGKVWRIDDRIFYKRGIRTPHPKALLLTSVRRPTGEEVDKAGEAWVNYFHREWGPVWLLETTGNSHAVRDH